MSSHTIQLYTITLPKREFLASRFWHSRVNMLSHTFVQSIHRDIVENSVDNSVVVCSVSHLKYSLFLLLLLLLLIRDFDMRQKRFRCIWIIIIIKKVKIQSVTRLSDDYFDKVIRRMKRWWSARSLFSQAYSSFLNDLFYTHLSSTVQNVPWIFLLVWSEFDVRIDFCVLTAKFLLSAICRSLLRTHFENTKRSRKVHLG